MGQRRVFVMVAPVAIVLLCAVAYFRSPYKIEHSGPSQPEISRPASLPVASAVADTAVLFSQERLDQFQADLLSLGSFPEPVLVTADDTTEILRTCQEAITVVRSGSVSDFRRFQSLQGLTTSPTLMKENADKYWERTTRMVRRSSPAAGRASVAIIMHERKAISPMMPLAGATYSTRRSTTRPGDANPTVDGSTVLELRFPFRFLSDDEQTFEGLLGVQVARRAEDQKWIVIGYSAYGVPPSAVIILPPG